jgi:mRNA-degrading endonuclease RelE of RelBE toxin-antitoxin system
MKIKFHKRFEKQLKKLLEKDKKKLLPLLNFLGILGY